MSISEQINLVDENRIDNFEVMGQAVPVFDAVLKAFLTQLDTLDIKKTKTLRQSILSQLSLRLSSQLERQRLNAWLTGDADKLEIDLGLADMQNCLVHAYHSVCDSLGPTITDEILAKALRETAELPIAAQFSPTNLFRK